MLCPVLYPIFAINIKKYNIEIEHILYVCLTIVFLIWCMCNHVNHIDVWVQDGLLFPSTFFGHSLKYGMGFERMFLEYLMGICAAKFYMKSNLNNTSLSFLPNILLILIVFIIYTGGLLGCVFPILVVILLSVSKLKAFAYNILSNKILLFFGKISYSMYVIHIFIVNIFDHYLDITTPQPVARISLMIIYIACLVICSICTYTVCEKYFYAICKSMAKQKIDVYKNNNQENS
ncbi:MAG: peptidoglycan/LPS O-acetylase OafA/YrhL [Candidatus Deianiraeaceae bacterium]|jgi:peptidoglycan/LPS O-acetylase OafA/YrhL